MSEAPNRRMVVAATDGFRYVGIKPGNNLPDNYVEAMPTVHGHGASVLHGITKMEWYADGSMSIGFDTEMAPELRDDRVLRDYAGRLAAFFDATLAEQETFPYVGPGSVYGQVVDGAEPTFWDQLGVRQVPTA